jgi:hypothetical protein
MTSPRIEMEPNGPYVVHGTFCDPTHRTIDFVSRSTFEPER